MMLAVDGGLDVVANDTRAAARGRHRTGVRVGQRDLLVRRCPPLGIERLKPFHLFLQLGDLLLEAGRLHLLGKGRRLPVVAVELVEIARHALFDLCHAALHLGGREVPVPVVHRLELRAVDRNPGLGQQTQPAAKRHEPGADLANGPAVVLAEIGDRLVIRNQAAGQPHDLDIAPRLALQPAARLNPVEIAVDVELQQN